MLRVERLGKRYWSGTWGLREFHMASEVGVTAIVGPAGAGKSTLLRMLATVTPPTEGAIAWEGVDVSKRPNAYRRALGYVPEQLGTYDGISGRAFLRYIAALKGLVGKGAAARVDEVLDWSELGDIADERMGGYSHAARWRVGLAQALLADPAVLLVDEVGNSLDEEERAALYTLIGRMANGRIAVVATSRAADVAGIATWVGMLNEAHLVGVNAEGVSSGSAYCRPDDLVHTVVDRVWSVTVDQNSYVELRRTCLLSDVVREGGGTHLRILAEAPPHPQAVPAEPTLADACAYHIDRDAASLGYAAGGQGYQAMEGV